MDISKGNVRKFTSYEDILSTLKMEENIREPLYVYYNPELENYLIWDGARRFKAGKEFGIKKFPCIVFPNIRNELEALRASLKHNKDSKVISYYELSRGMKSEFDELKKSMSETEARNYIQDHYNISSGELSRQLGVADIDKEFIEAVSRAKHLKLSGRLWYDISLLSTSVQKELATYKWPEVSEEDSNKWLRAVVKILRENASSLSMYSAKKKVKLAKGLAEEGASSSKASNYIKRRVESDKKAQDMRSYIKTTKEAIREVGGKRLPEKVMESRTLTLGPRVEYFWPANEAVAAACGISLEEHIVQNHLNPEAVNWLRARTEALGDKPKVRLKDLRKERKSLERKLEDLEKQIAEKEKEWARRRRH